MNSEQIKTALSELMETDVLVKLTDWESDFVNKLVDRTEQRDLTIAEAMKLKEICDKYDVRY